MIEFDTVTYSYSAGAVFRDVSLELSEGSFHFLTGPSGSGKTTFLRMCYGDLHPARGSVRFRGRDLSGLDRDGTARLRRNIGIVPQDCTFLDHLPVADNVALPLAVAGEDIAAAQGNLTDLLGWVGLGDRAAAQPPELSGGERQRAALARALILSPDLVVADEPTGNVDRDMSEHMLRLLVDLNEMGKTVLIATHDLALIRAAKSQVQARVMRIAQGRVQLAGADL